MTDHRPSTRPVGFTQFTAGQKVVTIVTMLAVAAAGPLFAYWAARPADVRPAATTPSPATARVETSSDDALGTGGDARTLAYQNRLNASVQAMLDTVVGPGHSVVTTTAELDLDEVETTTRTYTSAPKVAALAESISRQAWRGTAGRTAGVLGPGNDPVPAKAGTNWYDNNRIVRTNAVNQVTETRRRAPGTVTRLTVAVLLDATTAAAVDPVRIEQLVGTAVGYDAARGDTMAIAAMPFDTSIADQARQANADLAAQAAAELGSQ